MSSNPKQQVILIFFSTLLAGFSLGSIVSFSDPASSSLITFGFFYASLFLLVLGFTTLIGLGLRQWLWPGHYIVNLGNSFRQAFLIAILVAISFFLLSKRLLFWWVEGSLILFLGFVEAFLNLKV
ncbi:MAG TPA: hypothetical protein VE973_02470 [Candidatus Limnocylindria bacterium]|nr:hypothetical protein [Candidatus Limnocylindria bacterium]